MIRIFKTEDGTIHEKQEMQPGSWIALTNPTASEIIDVADACRIDPDHLKAPLDEEERSRAAYRLHPPLPPGFPRSADPDPPPAP